MTIGQRLVLFFHKDLKGEKMGSLKPNEVSIGQFGKIAGGGPQKTDAGKADAAKTNAALEAGLNGSAKKASGAQETSGPREISLTDFSRKIPTQKKDDDPFAE